LLLHEGVISEDEVSNHPMRNFVECCLGGDEPLPDMSLAAIRQLEPGDSVLICTDGLWSGVTDEALSGLTATGMPLDKALLELAGLAVRANAPNSDNTSAAALRTAGPSA
jgi:serine/threonine protein phosphatase PrpC